MTNGLYEAKRPMTVLAGRYAHPLHPMLVTVPIGAWTASLVFDVASRIVARPGFLAQGSEWLIAVGIVGALAAAGVGILDFYVIQTSTRAYRTVVAHMSLNLLVITAFGADFVLRFGQYHRPDAVPPAYLALSAASLAFLAVSGYLGGKLVYRYGVRVADEQTQAQGFTSRRAERARSGPVAYLPPRANRASGAGRVRRLASGQARLPAAGGAPADLVHRCLLAAQRPSAALRGKRVLTVLTCRL